MGGGLCLIVPSVLTTPNYNRTIMAKVNIKPIGDRVLVKHIEEKEQVRGGIIIPDSAKEKPQEAEVIALGTGKKDESGKVTPFEVKVGDTRSHQQIRRHRSEDRRREIYARSRRRHPRRHRLSSRHSTHNNTT